MRKPVSRRASLQQVWARARARLGDAGIDDASLEAEVLLRHCLGPDWGPNRGPNGGLDRGLDRAAFYSRLGDEMPARSVDELDRLVDRRAAREPLAYLLGRREFYGMDIAVTPAVLVPRPETELLVDLALARLAPASMEGRRDPRVLDVGTGSGCVALAIAAHAPDAEVHAVDLSEEALAVAARNREAHGLVDRVTLHLGDLMSPFVGTTMTFDLIVSNPPYIPSKTLDTLAPEVRAEPRMALDGGPDGLSVVRRFFFEAPGLLAQGGRLLVEVYSDHAADVAGLAAAAFPGGTVTIHPDLSGLPRVVEAGQQ